jgi:CRP/FNR family nitrogen fixation transcriptional regulator
MASLSNFRGLRAEFPLAIYRESRAETSQNSVKGASHHEQPKLAGPQARRPGGHTGICLEGGSAMMRAAPQFRPEGALLALGTVRHFAPDQVIYQMGDPVGYFIQVVAGMVRSTSLLSDGRRHIDAFHVTGNVFGFETASCHSRSAEAVCKSSAVFYPLQHLAWPGAGRDGLPRQIFEALMLGLAQARDHALLLGRSSAPERMAAFLLAWPAQGQVITLLMTRQDMADYLGLTVETVCRCLSQLKRDGLIDVLPGRQVKLLDIAALRGMTG